MNINNLIVVRHGERADEVSNEWEMYCRKNVPTESFYSRKNDPVLTWDGKVQAREVSKKIICEVEGKKIEKIFASKLLRAVQTAYEIALELSVPIVVSKGFALTAAAVAKKGDDFEFLSLDVLKTYCHGVTLIDGDLSDNQDISKTTNDKFTGDNSSFNAENMDKSECNQTILPELIPSKSWNESISYVAEKYPFSIVVAHRELIRNLACQYIRLPYCCYAYFNYATKPMVTDNDNDSDNGDELVDWCEEPEPVFENANGKVKGHGFEMKRLHHRTGEYIEFEENLPPPPQR